MNEERRPAGDRRTENATKHLASQDSATCAVVKPLPVRWATQLIANASGSFPTYGSAEWVALADDDRRKVAACVEAAECWRTRNYRADIYDFPQGRRAREIAEARRSRPGDYMGGPLPVWPAEVGDV